MLNVECSMLNVGVPNRICGCLPLFWDTNSCVFSTFRRGFALRIPVFIFAPRRVRRQNRCGNRGKCASAAPTRIFRRSHSNRRDRKKASFTKKTPTRSGEEANVE